MMYIVRSITSAQKGKDKRISLQTVSSKTVLERTINRDFNMKFILKTFRVLRKNIHILNV